MRELKGDRPKSNRAQIASAVIALMGFIAVIYQVGLISKNFKESAARQVYMSYSEASLRYPEFVEPDLAALKGTPKEYVRHKSFVYHMLFAYDEIIEVYDSPEWRKSLEIDFNYHMAYICNDMNAADDMSFFAKMRTILRETRSKCPNEKSKDR